MKTSGRSKDSYKCPKCGSDLSYDEVDIGVGTQQGNFRCDFCSWTPEDEIDPEFQEGE